MAVRVISRKAILEFIKHHPKAKSSLESWYGVVRRANWQSLAEVKTIYSSADVVGRRTVFNIAGNHFRLIARINYRVQAVYILKILTHKDYDEGAWKS
jgi:mRNA interferase HigB